MIIVLEMYFYLKKTNHRILLKEIYADIELSKKIYNFF